MLAVLTAFFLDGCCIDECFSLSSISISIAAGFISFGISFVFVYVWMFCFFSRLRLWFKIRFILTNFSRKIKIRCDVSYLLTMTSTIKFLPFSVSILFLIWVTFLFFSFCSIHFRALTLDKKTTTVSVCAGLCLVRVSSKNMNSVCLHVWMYALCVRGACISDCFGFLIFIVVNAFLKEPSSTTMTIHKMKEQNEID